MSAHRQRASIRANGPTPAVAMDVPIAATAFSDGCSEK